MLPVHIGPWSWRVQYTADKEAHILHFGYDAMLSSIGVDHIPCVLPCVCVCVCVCVVCVCVYLQCLYQGPLPLFPMQVQQHGTLCLTRYDGHMTSTVHNMSDALLLQLPVADRLLVISKLIKSKLYL